MTNKIFDHPLFAKEFGLVQWSASLTRDRKALVLIPLNDTFASSYNPLLSFGQNAAAYVHDYFDCLFVLY